METHSRAKVKHFLTMRDARDDARVHSPATRDVARTLDGRAKYARSVDIECEMHVQHHAQW